jgi:hypothetical protein
MSGTAFGSVKSPSTVGSRQRRILAPARHVPA